MIPLEIEPIFLSNPVNAIGHNYRSRVNITVNVTEKKKLSLLKATANWLTISFRMAACLQCPSLCFLRVPSVFSTFFLPLFSVILVSFLSYSFSLSFRSNEGPSPALSKSSWWWRACLSRCSALLHVYGSWLLPYTRKLFPLSQLQSCTH
jgi:hypothetical protein